MISTWFPYTLLVKENKAFGNGRYNGNQNESTYIIEGSLEVKLPTIWTDEKQSRAEAERRERLEERRSEKRKSQKKEDADARKGGKGRKVAKRYVFQWFVASEGRKVGSLKRRVRAIWPDERWKIARCCGAKHIS